MKTLLSLFLLLALGASAATGIKISEYPNTPVLTNSELFIVAVTNVTPATNRNISYGQLRSLLSSNNFVGSFTGDGRNVSNVVATSIAASNVFAGGTMVLKSPNDLDWNSPFTENNVAINITNNGQLLIGRTASQDAYPTAINSGANLHVFSERGGEFKRVNGVGLCALELNRDISSLTNKNPISILELLNSCTNNAIRGGYHFCYGGMQMDGSWNPRVASILEDGGNPFIFYTGSSTDDYTNPAVAINTYMDGSGIWIRGVPSGQTQDLFRARTFGGAGMVISASGVITSTASASFMNGAYVSSLVADGTTIYNQLVITNINSGSAVNSIRIGNGADNLLVLSDGALDLTGSTTLNGNLAVRSGISYLTNINSGSTAIPITLANGSDISMEITDLSINISNALDVARGSFIANNIGLGVAMAPNSSELICAERYATASTLFSGKNVLRLQNTKGSGNWISAHLSGAVSDMYFGGKDSADNAVRRFSISGSGSTEDLSVLGNGNVGISTVTPAEKLSVIGNISASGAVIATNAFVMPPVSAGPDWCTNGLAAIWNSNTTVYIRTSSVGATTFADKLMAP